MLPAFFISNETASPAGQEKVEITKELPGETVISPRSSATEGILLNVVWVVATLASFSTSILPSPLKLKDEVCRSALLGKRKTRLQVFPESDWGMSKLKILEIVEVIVPLKRVPNAVFGDEESTGTIR